MKRTLLSFATVVALSMPAGSSPVASETVIVVTETGAIVVGESGSRGEDVTPPQLLALSWTPTTTDTSAGAQTITVTAHITDDLSGASGNCQGRFVSPNGQQFVDFVLGTPISGTATDGIYGYTMTIPAFAESGIWTLSSSQLTDRVGDFQ